MQLQTITHAQKLTKTMLSFLEIMDAFLSDCWTMAFTSSVRFFKLVFYSNKQNTHTHTHTHTVTHIHFMAL